MTNTEQIQRSRGSLSVTSRTSAPPADELPQQGDEEEDPDVPRGHREVREEAREQEVAADAERPHRPGGRGEEHRLAVDAVHEERRREEREGEDRGAGDARVEEL